MESPDQVIVRLAVAFAVGALIGIERERSKGEGPHRETAGLRTFTLISLAGAISLSLGGIPAFIAFGVVTGLLAALGYSRTRETDPGLTSEIAMIVTFLLGGLVMQQPGLAAGLGVIVTILLAARTRAHDWAKNVLTDDEVREARRIVSAMKWDLGRRRTWRRRRNEGREPDLRRVAREYFLLNDRKRTENDDD